MKSIHVLRKPCSEPTVAANVLKHGTGGINVDVCRIHSDPSDLDAHRKMVEAIKARGGHMAHSWKNSSDLSGASDVSTAGRWPANIVLQHLDGCVQDGVKKVKPGNGSGRTGAGAHGFRTAYVGGESKGAGFIGDHVDEDGKETVAAWTCAEGCPVAALDRRSGILHPRGNVNPSTSGGSAGGSFRMPSIKDAHHVRFDLKHSGGASKLFKKFHGTQT